MKIGNYDISQNSNAFFIADIAANHDGDLKRAVELIKKAADAGADAAKFQNFKAKTIVSDSSLFRCVLNIFLFENSSISPCIFNLESISRSFEIIPDTNSLLLTPLLFFWQYWVL